MEKSDQNFSLNSQNFSCASKLDTPVMHGLYILVIFIASFAVYSNTLANGFVLDDKIQILQSELITNVKNIPRIFSEGIVSFTDVNSVSNNYRPMMNLVYLIDYHLFKFDPWGFHLTNILFHSVVSIIVFFVIKLLLRGPLSPNISPLPALAGALLFATHPIHTEAVAWVAAVPDLTFTLFTLLAFFLYMKAREGSGRAYPFSVAAFALATLCKETALVLPLFLFAYDFTHKKEDGRASGYLKRYWPYLLVAGGYLAVRYFALGGIAPREANLRLSGYLYVINIFPLFAQYLWKLVAPINLQTLYVFHPINNVTDARGLLSLFVTLAFAVIFVVACKKRNPILLPLAIIVLPLVPVLVMYRSLGIFGFAERYLYLPSFGFVIILSLLLSKLDGKRKNLALLGYAAAALVVATYSFGTLKRNPVWKDEFTLYSDVVKKSPDSFYAHNFLGVHYIQKGRINEAVDEFRTAIKLNPDSIDSHYNLGLIYMSLGQRAEAAAEFNTVLSINPNHPQARQMLFFMLRKK